VLVDVDGVVIRIDNALLPPFHFLKERNSVGVIAQILCNGGVVDGSFRRRGDLDIHPTEFLAAELDVVVSFT
jgi:hypothetical protein